MLTKEKLISLKDAFLAQSEFEYLPFQAINAPVMAGRKFRYLFLTPDSKAIAEACEANQGLRSHEEIMGE
jgi:hypothetical protein